MSVLLRANSAPREAQIPCVTLKLSPKTIQGGKNKEGYIHQVLLPLKQGLRDIVSRVRGFRAGQRGERGSWRTGGGKR